VSRSVCDVYASIPLCEKIGNEECETDLIQQLKSGDSTALLPETPEQLRHMIDTLTVRKVGMPQFFVNGFLDLRLRLLDEHKKGNETNYLSNKRIESTCLNYSASIAPSIRILCNPRVT
jgi:hypothetical protein